MAGEKRAPVVRGVSTKFTQGQKARDLPDKSSGNHGVVEFRKSGGVGSKKMVENKSFKLENATKTKTAIKISTSSPRSRRSETMGLEKRSNMNPASNLSTRPKTSSRKSTSTKGLQNQAISVLNRISIRTMFLSNMFTSRILS